MIRVDLNTKRDSAGFEAEVGERLLFAGLRAGLDLPYECVSGACGSCQAQLLSAAPEAVCNLYPDAPAATDLAAGRLLMCQTACAADVELRLFARLRNLPEGQPRPRYVEGDVRSLQQIARDTYALSVGTAERLPYQAGQFAMLSVDGVPGYRAYSMTASPRIDGPLEFVIKTRNGGAFSDWLCRRAQPGSPVRVFGPLGRAVLPQTPRRLFAIAAGTGIAGILSVFEEAILRGDLTSAGATLVFGVRTEADAFALERLSEWAHLAQGRVAIVVALSEGHAAAAARYPTLTFASGLVLDVARARLEQDHHEGACFFVAGPPPVVDGALAMLTDHFGVPRNDVRFDRFQ